MAKLPTTKSPQSTAELVWSQRRYRELLERDRAALFHHLQQGTLVKHLKERGQTADIAFRRLTLAGGIDPKAADKEVAETYINVPPDTDPLDGAADKELRTMLVEWEKGPGRPFVTPLP